MGGGGEGMGALLDKTSRWMDDHKRGITYGVRGRHVHMSRMNRIRSSVNFTH